MTIEVRECSEKRAQIFLGRVATAIMAMYHTTNIDVVTDNIRSGYDFTRHTMIIVVKDDDDIAMCEEIWAALNGDRDPRVVIIPKE